MTRTSLQCQLLFLLLLSLRGWTLDVSSVDEDTIDQRNAAVSMLDTSLREVCSSDTLTRLNICMHSSDGYSVIDRPTAALILTSCFERSLLIKDPDRNQREQLQLAILERLFELNPTTAESLLVRATPTVQWRIRPVFLQSLIREQKYDRALSAIDKASWQDDFPYAAAEMLMSHLGQNRDGHVNRVFMDAFRAYNRAPYTVPAVEDFATLIIRFWKYLPASSVKGSVDKVLQRSRIHPGNQRLVLQTNSGEAHFTSAYQFRLFELVPILTKVEASEAALVLQRNAKLSQVLKRYPEGLASLESSYSEPILKQPPKLTISVVSPSSGGEKPGKVPPPQFSPSGLAAQIPFEWQSNPDALRELEALPNHISTENGRSPRADGLARIASLSYVGNPALSNSALKNLLLLTPSYPLFSRGFYTLVAARVKAAHGDTSGAKDLLVQAMTTARQLYTQDQRTTCNPSKLFWRSTALWRSAFLLQTRIDRGSLQSALTEIPDQEIRAEVRTVVANQELGVEIAENVFTQCHGTRQTTRDFPVLRSSLSVPE